VDAHLEVASGRHPLAGDRVVIGRSPRSDIVLDADGQVSRTHAVLDRIAGRWILRDAGSRNGTRVNGEPVRGRVRLRAGDEIRIGRSTLLLRAVPPADDPVTERQPPPPTLTARERDVLLAVVRPLVAAGRSASPPPPRRSPGACG
jgi:pSer/pThr/pTyr-binding forkhead associated (FHA) protein